VELARRTLQLRVARTIAMRSGSADDAIVESTAIQPVGGVGSVELARRALQLKASRTLPLRTTHGLDLSEESPVPAVATTRPLGDRRRARIRAAIGLLWTATGDREQAPLTPWTQAVVGTDLVGRAARTARTRAVISVPYRLSGAVLTKPVPIIAASGDRLVSPAAIGDEQLQAPVDIGLEVLEAPMVCDDESWVP